MARGCGRLKRCLTPVRLSGRLTICGARVWMLGVFAVECRECVRAGFRLAESEKGTALLRARKEKVHEGRGDHPD
jgi:hypothetical protein